MGKKHNKIISKMEKIKLCFMEKNREKKNNLLILFNDFL